MLSAMTTSENFPLVDRSRCSPPVPAYDSVIQPAYVATILRQNLKMASGKDGGHLIDYRLIRDGNLSGGKISYYLTDSAVGGRDAEEGLAFTGSGEKENEMAVVAEEYLSPGTISKSDFESELTDFLDHLDLDDSICEQSKPLKIDPNVLKLDFSKIQIDGNLENLDKLYSCDFSENKRASHHLSGGILLTDASHEQFPDSDSSKNRLCKLSGGGLIATGNSFDFDRFKTSSPDGSADFPQAFDLTSTRTGNGNSFQSVPVNRESSSECTNPFKKFIEDVESKVMGEGEAKKGERLGEEEQQQEVMVVVKEEEENPSFSPTNPFSDFRRSSSSPNETGNGTCDFPPSPPKYENFSFPRKSFSQCSTRPTSPVFKIPQESFPSNPFLLNDSSPPEHREEEPSPPFPAHFFPSESSSHRNSSSFIFAVPVFSFLHPQSIITDSSTQTVDNLTSPVATATRLATVAPPPSLPPPSDFPHRKKDPERETPIYQNVTNQLNKFIRHSNDHSEYDLNCLRRNLKELRISGWYYEKVSWKESAILLRNSQPGTFLIRDSSDPNFLFSLSVQTCRGPTSVRLHYVNGQFRLDAEEKLIPQLPSFGSVIELIDHYVEKTIANGKKNGSGREKCRSDGKTWMEENGEGDKSIGDHQVWIDSRGNVYSNILLAKPLRRSERLPSLQHLARLRINSQLRRKSNSDIKFNFKVTPVYESSPFQDGFLFQRNNNFDELCPILNADSLPIPRKLIDYLRDYPYCH